MKYLKQLTISLFCHRLLSFKAKIIQAVQSEESMTLTITSATKTMFGQWELSTRINDKSYKYYLSDYGYQKAMQLYNKGLQGKALAVLNKHNEATS